MCILSQFQAIIQAEILNPKVERFQYVLKEYNNSDTDRSQIKFAFYVRVRIARFNIKFFALDWQKTTDKLIILKDGLQMANTLNTQFGDLKKTNDFEH